MAKPIKETPILRGVDAKKFFDNMAQSESNRISTSDRAKIKSNFEKLNSLSQF